LRSQHGIQLIGGKDKLTLEEVIARKHSMRMLLADALKDDLIAALAATQPAGEMAAALELLKRWDNTASADSRGSVLFESWWNRYVRSAPPPTPGTDPDLRYVTRPWSASDPMRMPDGLASAERAVEALSWAIDDVRNRFGAIDVSWGDVHRVRRGSVDVPVGGCSGQLGCFRVLWFASEPDGKLVATGGDGWVLAVEFGAVPRAYSVLAYSNSIKPAVSYFDDQAAMFARGELKPVAFTQKDIERTTICRYHPGLAVQRTPGAGSAAPAGTCGRD
jgi:acyl-homoserine-lactone acylase